MITANSTSFSQTSAPFHIFFLSSPLPFLFLLGYFTQISTLADVQENVMEYLHVLSRPKVIDREHDTVWTEAYIDNTVSRQHHLSLLAVPLSFLHPPEKSLLDEWFRKCGLSEGMEEQQRGKKKSSDEKPFKHVSQAVCVGVVCKSVCLCVCTADGTIKSMGLQCVFETHEAWVEQCWSQISP